MMPCELPFILPVSNAFALVRCESQLNHPTAIGDAGRTDPHASSAPRPPEQAVDAPSKAVRKRPRRG